MTNQTVEKQTMSEVLTGGCQCGAIRYQIEGDPLTLAACHCTECQRQSSSAFGLSMVVAKEAFAITGGGTKQWHRQTPSGADQTCHFCADCGVRIYHASSGNPAIYIVKAGTLDDTGALVPAGQIWTGSAQPWLKDISLAVNDPAQPPDFSELIQAWQNHAQ